LVLSKRLGWLQEGGCVRGWFLLIYNNFITISIWIFREPILIVSKGSTVLVLTRQFPVLLLAAEIGLFPFG
jgi:hypothetical protein